MTYSSVEWFTKSQQDSFRGKGLESFYFRNLVLEGTLYQVGLISWKRFCIVRIKGEVRNRTYGKERRERLLEGK